MRLNFIEFFKCYEFLFLRISCRDGGCVLTFVTITNLKSHIYRNHIGIFKSQVDKIVPVTARDDNSIFIESNTCSSNIDIFPSSESSVEIMDPNKAKEQIITGMSPDFYNFHINAMDIRYLPERVALDLTVRMEDSMR